MRIRPAAGGRQEQDLRDWEMSITDELRHLEVDHVIPRSSGGTDHIENLQLLCAHCNRVKGDRPQESLVARLPEMGMAA